MKATLRQPGVSSVLVLFPLFFAPRLPSEWKAQGRRPDRMGRETCCNVAAIRCCGRWFLVHILLAEGPLLRVFPCNLRRNLCEQAALHAREGSSIILSKGAAVRAQAETKRSHTASSRRTKEGSFCSRRASLHNL